MRAVLSEREVLDTVTVINFTETLCAASWLARLRLSTITPSNADEPRTVTVGGGSVKVGR